MDEEEAEEYFAECLRDSLEAYGKDKGDFFDGLLALFIAIKRTLGETYIYRRIIPMIALGYPPAVSKQFHEILEVVEEFEGRLFELENHQHD